MKPFGLLLFFLLLISYENSWCQNEYYRSSELNFSKATLDGIVSGENLVINLALEGVHTICLFQDNSLIQKRGISASELLLRGILEKGNSIYVFFSFKSSGKWQEGVLTFYKNNLKPPTFERTQLDGNVLFTYNYDEGFHKIVLDKKKGSLELLTYYMNNPSSVTSIDIRDTELEKVLSKKEFSFIYLNTNDFNLLASGNKAFPYEDKIVLLIDEDELPAITPKLKRIVLNFPQRSFSYREIRLPLAPNSEHSSYLHSNNIFTWGINKDYFSLSVFSLDSLSTEASFVYLKSVDNIPLKATPVFYATGAPQNDKDWEWKDTSIKRVNEDKPSDLLKQFARGSIVFKVKQEKNHLQLLFGTYQGAIGPSTNRMPSTVPGVVIPTTAGTVTTSPTLGFTSLTQQGIVERRKYFYGFINPLDWTILNDTSADGILVENKLDNRMKEIYEDEKIGGMASILAQEKGYLVYLLKKEKELVIEEIK